MKRAIEEVNQADSTKVTFSGMYYLVVGFLWQFVWQISMTVNYASWFHVTKETFYWIQVVSVCATITYLAGHMVYLETEKRINSMGLLIKYVIGLTVGCLLGKLWL